MHYLSTSQYTRVASVICKADEDVASIPGLKRSLFMKRKTWQLPCILLLFLAFGCGNDLLDPRFEPEISNKIDSFEFQATDIRDVSQTVTYSWEITSEIANINQASTLTSGTGILILVDSQGEEVYRQDLNDNGTFQTNAGTSGHWTITIQLSEANGTINFSAEKRTN